MPKDNETELLQKQPSTRRLVPVNDWSKIHLWPPIGGLRHLIFHADTNGFKSAFRRVGGRVLVDEMEFFKCIDRKNEIAD